MGIFDRFRTKFYTDDPNAFFKHIDSKIANDTASKALNGVDRAYTEPVDGNLMFSTLEDTSIVPKPSPIAFGRITDVLRQYSMNVVLNAIINTRANQVTEYAHRASADDNGMGYQVRLKNGDKPTKEQQKKIDYAERYIERMGVDYSPIRDDFTSFLRKLVRDTYTYDQVNYENTYDSNGRLSHTRLVDPTTIYFANDEHGHRRTRGKIYRQYIDNKVRGSFTADEMGMFIRNPRSDILSGGYGLSELEMGLREFISHENTELFNDRFFTHGGTTKGILLVKPSPSVTNTSMRALEDFKRHWTATSSGINGAYRIPMITAEDAKFVSMTQAEDMQFQSWLNYLINIICALVAMDPAEIGMQNRGGATGNKSNSLNESNNQNKIDASKSKGLMPLLDMIAKNLTNGIIRQILGDNYMLEFVGGDTRSQQDKLKSIQLELQTATTVNDYREKQGLPKIAGGDIILSAVYIQRLGQQEQIKQNEFQRQQTRLTQLESALQNPSGTPPTLPPSSSNSFQQNQEGYTGKDAKPSGKDNQQGVGKDGQLKNKKNTNSYKQGGNGKK